MEEIEKFIGDFSAEALEMSTKIAGVALVADSGVVVYQTENFDLKNQGGVICQVHEGLESFELNNFQYSVSHSSSGGIVAKSTAGMGIIAFAKIQGGFLVVYAMPGADAKRVLSFLKTYVPKCEGLL